MRGNFRELPVSLELKSGKIRDADWGGMTVEVGDIRREVDTSSLYAGLPDNRCQSPHWGYVMKGQLRYRFPDHEEVYKAGELYYVEPNHLEVRDNRTRYVEFSPTDRYKPTIEATLRNIRSEEPQH